MPASSAFWRAALTVPEDHVPAFADAVGETALAVSTFEIEEGVTWLIEATFGSPPDRGELSARVAVVAAALGIAEPVLELDQLPAIDWVARVYQGFPPIRVGRFFIYGSHFEGEVPPGAVGLLVDAATAFGTGEHGSTNGCLQAIDRLARRFTPRRKGRRGGVLDMGCGSGILAMAAVKTWRVSTLAIDIDPEAVRVARLNTKINRLSGSIRSEGGDGYKMALVRCQGPYRLVTANILARPLARMAPGLRRVLAKGGYAILAGLLARQERHVLAAHRAQGLRLVARIPVGEWTTLIVKR